MQPVTAIVLFFIAFKLHGMEQTISDNKEWDGKIYGRPSKIHDKLGVELLDHLDLTRFPNILHIGCGLGKVTEAIGKRVAPGTKVFGFDSSAPTINQAQEKYKYEIHMPLLLNDINGFEPEKKIDLVVSFGCLQRCKKQTHVFKRIFEYLNKSGRMLITLAPTRKGLNKADFEAMLQEIGFIKITIQITESALIAQAVKP